MLDEKIDCHIVCLHESGEDPFWIHMLKECLRTGYISVYAAELLDEIDLLIKETMSEGERLTSKYKYVREYNA